MNNNIKKSDLKTIIGYTICIIFALIIIITVVCFCVKITKSNKIGLKANKEGYEIISAPTNSNYTVSGF